MSTELGFPVHKEISPKTHFFCVLAIINIPLDFQHTVLVDFDLTEYIMKFESRLSF